MEPGNFSTGFHGCKKQLPYAKAAGGVSNPGFSTIPPASVTSVMQSFRSRQQSCCRNCLDFFLHAIRISHSPPFAFSSRVFLGLYFSAYFLVFSSFILHCLGFIFDNSVLLPGIPEWSRDEWDGKGKADFVEYLMAGKCVFYTEQKSYKGSFLNNNLL